MQNCVFKVCVVCRGAGVCGSGESEWNLLYMRYVCYPSKRIGISLHSDQESNGDISDRLN